MKHQNTFLIFLILSICLSLIMINILPVFSAHPPRLDVPEISADMYLSFTTERKSSFDLKYVDHTYLEFSGERTVSRSRFAYVWIELSNNGEIDREIILANGIRNYYTELLSPDDSGAVTLFRHGDIVPLAESPFRHYKSGFPLFLKAGTTTSYVLEFHGPRGLAIEPEVLSCSTWLNRVARERSLVGFICGVFVFLLLVTSISGIIIGRKYSISVAFFIASVFFFFLRQSRILLLVLDTWSYPEWLYPLTITLNILGALVFAGVLLGEYLNLWKKVVLRTVGGIAIVLTIASFLYDPYMIADILNLLPFIAIPVIFGSVVRAVKKKDIGILFITLSLIPWIVMFVVDIISAFMDVRLSFPLEYRQAFGMIASLFLLAIATQYVQSQKHRKGHSEVVDELRQVRMEMAGQVTSVTELRASVLHQVGYQLRQPLDSILALAMILSNEYADPRINAVSKVLTAEAGALKRKIENEVGNPGILEVSFEQDGDAQDLKQAFEDVPAPRPWINSRICLYDTDPGHAARTALILRSRGYDVVIMSDQYRILSSVSTGKVDVLIVDPTSAGENAFALCGLIRGDYNLFEIPILMITNYYADYLMKKGYAAGVNDFLTRPFDASELAARVQSLIKLKQVARHNHDLARSEKEKNTFLYFLTHNINTPLTLLLNRVNELQDFEDSHELDEITDDLLATSREISDIVQNVLISFRLSDGRQTVRLNEIEIEPILSAVRRDLQKKADEKSQMLICNIPDTIPQVMGDFTAVRGIIYNLIDNGLKFSPEGAEIVIKVSVSDSVNIEISDTGPGIPAADQDRLFERFERLSPQPTAGESSTGLGLYVAHELALMNGGTLEYISGRGGACFLFTIQKFFKEAVDV